MTSTSPRTAVLMPAAATGTWVATEPVTSPIPIIEPATKPIPEIGDRPGTGVPPDPQHMRQASVLTGLVLLVLLAGLLLGLGVV